MCCVAYGKYLSSQILRNNHLISVGLAVLVGFSSSSVSARADRPAADANSPTSSFNIHTNSQYCEKVLAKVDQLISKHLYSASLAKNEWPKAKAEFNKEILDSNTLIELGASMNKAIKQLHSSHCQFVTINDETYFFLNALFSRFNRKLKNTKMDYTGVVCGGAGLPVNQVRYILDGSPGEQAKVQVGDKILTVNGEPYVGQSNFFKTSGKKLRIVVDRGGKRTELTVVPVFKDPYSAYVEAMSKSIRIIETPEGKIGYVHLWAGGGEAHEAFEELLGTKLSVSDGLIMDMRDGYGGNSLSDLDFFYRDPIGYPAFSLKNRAGHQSEAKMVYDKPVVALINGGSRSGKELLAFSLKRSGRAKLIGERTAGFVLGGRLIPIDERTALYLAVADGDIDGVRLEAKGVDPDILVPNADYSLAGQQAQFDKAKETLVPLLKKPITKKEK